MRKSTVYIVSAAVIFSTMEPISKSIGGIMNPAAVVFIRFSIGGAFLLPFCIYEIRKREIHISISDFVKLGLDGLLFISSNILTQIAVEHTKASIVAIIFCTNPIFTIPLAIILLKERINPKTIMCILVCALGIFCFFLAERTDMSLGDIALTLMPPILFALYNVLSQKNMQKWNSGMIVTSLTFIASGLIPALLLGAIDKDFFRGLSMEIVPQLIYLGFVVAGLGFYLYFKAINASSAIIASATFYIKIALAPIIAFILLKEKINIWSIIGIILILLGSIPLMLMKLPSQSSISGTSCPQ